MALALNLFVLLEAYLLIGYAYGDGPINCVPLTAKACKGAGYDLTADFPAINGRPYQEVKEKSLEFFLSFLHHCSPYSKTIMCSLYMPKCAQGRPVLPCRNVCLEFVSKCQIYLSLASHAGMFRALCDLLPEQTGTSENCFIPEGFSQSMSTTDVPRRGGSCSRVEKPKYCSTDLHYSQTFVPETDQTSIIVLKKIKDSQCSPVFEKYLCYTTVPPCKPNDRSVYVPCRSVCKQVKSECGEEFNSSGIFLPDCSPTYPEDDDPHNKGLCQLSEFPVAWPVNIEAECALPLGMENRFIPDYAITASSEWDGNYGPTNARLNFGACGGKRGAWSSKTNDKSQWIQVDLRENYQVTKICTQGRQDHAQWVTRYKISYSTDGQIFTSKSKVYEANRDQNTIVVNTLEAPIKARFIRLEPQEWYGHISMRMELYGCSLKSECSSPMGMENKLIPDYAITASSEWDRNHGPTNARLYHMAGGGKAGAWSSRINSKSQYIQVDFGEVKRVTQIASQGHPDAAQWVTHFLVYYSTLGKEFKFQNHVYKANSDQHSVVVNTLIYPVEARYVRLNIEAWYGHISMRFEIYGCHAYADCDSPLGIESGDIPNSDMTASSEWDANHQPSNARINRPASGGKAGAWSARTSDLVQWIQVNFRELTRVTEVVIQGRQDYPQWVTAFKLSYSLDGYHFNSREKIYQGNNDQNSPVINTLMEPIEARFIRLHPYAWYGHTSLRMELYGCSLKPECAKPLGLEIYRIPNSAISASSEWDGNHGPTNARLNKPSGGGKTGAWSSKTNDANQWIQVKFCEVTKVTQVGIQGRYDANQWVTKFKVSYSLDGIHFSTQSKVYDGNSNRNGIIINDLETPMVARAVRINPIEWYGHISMRMELYGCRLSSECAAPLGMENGLIPSYAITASSEWDAYHEPSNARLHFTAGGGKRGAWSSRINDKSQWIQVDLRVKFQVTKIATQGRQDHAQWVTQYNVSHSTDGKIFISENKMYEANRDQNTVVVNTLEAPIQARFIRLKPQNWHGHISMRMELYGCSLNSVCASPMGMENKLIPDYAITASSEWDGNHGPTNARLYHIPGGGKTGAWSSRTNDKSQWIKVDLGEVNRVTQIASQGRSDAAQWVTKFRVSYSTLGKEFRSQDHVYKANSDQNSVVVNTLIYPIEARFVRLDIEAWYGHISMRFELYGCHIHVEECISSLGLTSRKLPDSALSASSEWDGNHGANNARLYHVSGGGRIGAWSSKLNNKGQWLEVDIGETAKVTMVATQGRYDYDQWVKSYKVAHSKFGGHFVFQNKVYDANSDRNSVIVNELIQPIEARFIRIYPESWHGHMSMRLELYGCEIHSDCMSPLMMENDQIPDSSITASSVWDVNHGPNNARVYHMAGGGRTGAWSARTSDKGQWIQVNLGKSREVTKVGIQGRQDYAQWVTKYRLSYSTDGQHFTSQNQEYIGSKDQNTVVISDLIQPIKARYVRILPQAWHGHISMRMELYGCANDSG